MSRIIIDEAKCVRCGICSAVCPRHIIEFKDMDSYPIVRTDAICFECGQCMVSCQCKAVTVNNISQEHLIPIEKELELSPNQLQQFFKSRRSVRNFTDKPVDRETLQRILDIASYAPTGKNWPLVNWVVIEDANEVHRIAGMIASNLKRLAPVLFPVGRVANKGVRKMMRAYPNLCKAMKQEFVEMTAAWDQGADRILRNAPHLIIAYADTRNVMAHDGCITALTHLELAAHGFGVGACWAGILGLYAQFTPSFAQELGIPKNNEIIGAMMLGYPKFKYHSIPYRSSPQIIWR